MQAGSSETRSDLIIILQRNIEFEEGVQPPLKSPRERIFGIMERKREKFVWKLRIAFKWAGKRTHWAIPRRQTVRSGRAISGAFFVSIPRSPGLRFKRKAIQHGLREHTWPLPERETFLAIHYFHQRIEKRFRIHFQVLDSGRGSGDFPG